MSVPLTPIDPGKQLILNSETTLIDGLSIVDLISNYAGVKFKANRSGIIDTAAKLSGGPYKKQLINNSIYEMPFIQWYGLVDFVINNVSSKDSAKFLVNTLVVGDAIKEELVYSETGIKNVVDYAYGFKFKANLNSPFVNGLNNYIIDGDGNNDFDLDFGVSLSGTTGITVSIVDEDFVEQASDVVTLDSNGRATASIVLSSFSQGYVYLKSGILWNKSDYSSTLVSSINLAQLVDFSSYNYIGTSAVIAAKKSSIVNSRNSAIAPYIPVE